MSHKGALALFRHEAICKFTARYQALFIFVFLHIFLVRFGVGQNLYIYKQTLKAPANDWVAAVTDWYDEVALFRNKDVQPFAFSTATGHYTQVVWSTTDKVKASSCPD